MNIRAISPEVHEVSYGSRGNRREVKHNGVSAKYGRLRRGMNHVVHGIYMLTQSPGPHPSRRIHEGAGVPTPNHNSSITHTYYFTASNLRLQEAPPTRTLSDGSSKSIVLYSSVETSRCSR